MKINNINNEKIIIKIKKIAEENDGCLPCALALKLADEENVAPFAIGNAANQAKIKIKNCQLGCFNGKSKSK